MPERSGAKTWIPVTAALLGLAVPVVAFGGFIFLLGAKAEPQPAVQDQVENVTQPGDSESSDVAVEFAGDE